VPNPNLDLDNKIDGNPHKLAIEHKIRTIKTQVDWYVETLIFLDLKININLVQLNVYFQNFLNLESTFT
jgi:hypothetical protein